MYKWPTVKWNKEDLNPWVTWFNKQVGKENNCINGIVTGGPGSGKSYFTLAQLYARNPDFDINEQVFFNAAKMTRAFRDGKYFDRPGKEIMFDEAGIDFGSSTWQSAINKSINSFFQTARHRNYIFLMTVPHMGFVSKGIRSLMTCQFKANGWNKENLTKIMPRVIDYNGEMDKFYKKRLVVMKDNMLNYCDEIRTPLPPDKIRKEYEKMKTEFTDKLFNDIEKKIKGFESREEQKTYGLTPGEYNILNGIRAGLSDEEIAEKYGLQIKSLPQMITHIRVKGIKIEKRLHGPHILIDDSQKQKNR